MSAYITRWCQEHGEWDMDVDNPRECYKCEDEGKLDWQKKDAEIEHLRSLLSAREAALEKANAALRALTIECGMSHEGLPKYAVDNYPDNDRPIIEPEIQEAVRLAHATSAETARGEGGDDA